MARRAIPEDAGALWRWMAEKRVTIEELAEVLDITPQYLGEIRRGEKTPSDALKRLIATATIAIEERLGVAPAERRGVPIMTWYEDTGGGS